MPFMHGVTSKQENAGTPPIQGISTSVIGTIITAPMGRVNENVLINSKADGVKEFGSGVGSVDDTLNGIFDQGSATCVFINVLDPAVHFAPIAATEYTFDAVTDEFTPANEYNYASDLKSQDTLTDYTEGVDYTYDIVTNKYKRIDGGGIAAGGTTISLSYNIPDASLVDDAAVIGGIDAQGKRSGLELFRVAKTKVGAKPRIIGTPQLDTEAVKTALPPILDALKAFGYASTNSATKELAVANRALFGSKRLMLIHGDFLDADGNTLYAIARVLGMRAKIDNLLSWSKTISNVVINGVSGIDRDISWDLQDPNTDANFLNENHITTLINEKGFRFWGDRTTSAEPDWVYESATRSSDVISDTIAEAQMPYVSAKMTKVTLGVMVDRVNAKIRQWKANGDLVDGKCWMDPAKNTESILAAGNPHFTYNFSPIPPIENPTFIQQITTEYYDQLLP